MTEAQPTETRTLHFDLNHCDHLPDDQKFTLRGDGLGRTLVRHTDETRCAHAADDLALAAMPEAQRARLSHYCTDVEMPTDTVSWRWVGYASNDPEALTDDVALLFQHCASHHVRRAVRELRADSGAPVPTMLTAYGVEAADDEDHDELHVAASRFVTPIASALAIIMKHPDIGTILPKDHYQIKLKLAPLTSLPPLWSYISRNPPGNSAEPWYVQTVCVDADGNPLRPYDSLTDKNGDPVVWPKKDGQSVIPHHKLSERVDHLAKPAIQDSVRLLKADSTLKGIKWTTQHGVTLNERTGGHQAPAVSAVQSAAGADWTLKNTTSQYGLSIYPKTLKFDGNQLTFDVKNWPNRGLGVHWQAFKPDNTPLGEPQWLQMIGAGDTVFGIPVDLIAGGITTLSIPVPAAASQVDFLLGGIGHGNKRMAVDWQGIVYTSVVSYGLPSVMIALSVGLLSAKPLTDEFKDRQVLNALLKIGRILFQPAVSPQSKYTLGKTLSMAAEMAGGILLGKLPALAAKIATTVAAKQLVESAPFVGWVVRIASITAAVADMIATSVEVAKSPYTYVLEAKRSMALGVTVKPDPTHGTSSQGPIWPKVSDHWVVTVQFKGGTTLRKAGPMPAGDDTPISVLFSKATLDELPSAPGDQFQIITAVYSKTNWVAGTWVSGWIDAVPTDGDQRNETGSIIERLVPLTASTQYHQQEKLTYDGATSAYVWQNVVFSLPDALEPAFQPGPAAADVIAAFWGKGVRLSAATTVATAGTDAWTVSDPGDGVDHAVVKQPIVDPGTGKVIGAELAVSNTTHPAPTGTADNLPTQDVTDLVDITINNLAYKVGYCYKGQNQGLPLDDGTAATADPMYLVQSISTLAHPQAGMKTPTRGFSGMSHIAYDQFGPSGLFELKPAATYQAELDAFTKAQPVPADMATSFTASGHPLPAGATAVVVRASAAWRIATSNGTALYDLRRQTDVIKIFNAPAPEFSPNNFFLDSRTYATDGLHHLRLVDLHDDSGSTFDYDSQLSWGAFAMANLNAIAVHPNGVVVAISYDDDQMSILELPEKGVADNDAPLAIPMTGQGVREGLMRGPVGMTVTADGRILVLERTGARIQAFDSLGNPAQSFKAELSFDLDTALVDDLNQAAASPGLLQALQRQVPVHNSGVDAFDRRYLLKPLLSVDPALGTSLDAATVDSDLRNAFAQHGITLSEKVAITTTTAGTLWLLADQGLGTTYDLRLDGERQGQIDVYRAMTPVVTVKAPGGEWTIRDQTNTLTFDVKLQPAPTGGGKTLHAVRLQSLMRLKTGTAPSIVYLDVAVESKGFIYVLLYEKPATGPLKPSDYRLDIYNPDGTPVASDPSVCNGVVNGGRMTVDQWRTVFTLNYEQIHGAAGRPEPTVSQWIPTTPEGAK